MERYETSLYGLVQTARDGSPELIWPTLVAIFIFSLIATRIVTGFQSRPDDRTDTDQLRPARMVPYWFPWLGHSISFGHDHVAFIQRARNYMNEAVFSIKMGNTKHNIVVSPSITKSILSSRATSTTALIKYVVKNVGGDMGPIRNLNPVDFHALHHNIPDLFMREPFLTEASTAATRLIERETPNLVTFCESVVDQTPWERRSESIVVHGNDKSVCEINLFALLRNFVGHITTSVFMGQAILENFPDFLDDMWKLDDRSHALALGVPRWFPLPGISAAYAARDRTLATLAAFHQAFIDWDDGNPRVRFRELDDVSEPMKQRIRKSRELGLSPKSSASGHLLMLWAMNGNSPNVLFWHLLRLYSDPVLLEEIRNEIAPYAKVSRPSPEETGFPFQEPPKISIDLEGILPSCHLLKASFYETLRLDSAGISFREVTSDLTIAESNEDAAVADLRQPRKYKIKEGENVALTHGVIQNDTRYFSNPGQFDPLRFIVTDPETGAKRAEMHTIHPFGGGVSGCKGRAFAEREILVLSAAIVSTWEIEPANGKGFTIPDHRPSSGAFLPKKDIRVRMKMRV